MPAAIVEQLVNGVKVRLGDGRELVCRPLPLADAMTIINHWDAMGRADASPSQIADAKLGILRCFATRYPELATEIAAGDVEGTGEAPGLIHGFFWGRTGALVVRPSPAASTGTASGESTSPTGASSPTS